MKFMGVDYGIKRIGVAISDDEGKIAFPKINILNDSLAFSRLQEIIKSNGVSEIVIGESLNLKGHPNPIQARIEIFIEELKSRTDLPVYKQKEFLTTIEARKEANQKESHNVSRKRTKEKTPMADAKAAALILQRYLDRISKKNSDKNK